MRLLPRFLRVLLPYGELLPDRRRRSMLKFLKDLVLGEPALSLGLISTGLGAWVAALVGMGEAVPVWLAVATPVSSATAAVYTRQHVDARHESPIARALTKDG